MANVAPRQLAPLQQDLKSLERSLLGVIAVSRASVKSTGFLGLGRKSLQEMVDARLDLQIERNTRAIDGEQLSGDDLAEALCDRAEALAERGRAGEGLRDAEQAVEDLLYAGFGRENVARKSGPDIVASHAYYELHRTLWQRLGAAIPSEEGDLDKLYVRAAADGQSMVGVRVARPEDAKRAAAILHQHRAHLVRYFRPFTIEDL